MKTRSYFITILMLLAFISQTVTSVSLDETMKHHGAAFSPSSYSLMAGNNAACEKMSLSLDEQDKHTMNLVPDCCKDKQHCPMNSCVSAMASVTHSMISFMPDVRQKHPKNIMQALIKRHSSLYRPPIFA